MQAKTIQNVVLMNPDTSRPFVYEADVLDQEGRPVINNGTRATRWVPWDLWDLILKSLAALNVGGNSFEVVEAYGRISDSICLARADGKHHVVVDDQELWDWLRANCKVAWPRIAGKDLVLVAWRALNTEQEE